MTLLGWEFGLRTLSTQVSRKTSSFSSAHSAGKVLRIVRIYKLIRLCIVLKVRGKMSESILDPILGF